MIGRRASGLTDFSFGALGKALGPAQRFGFRGLGLGASTWATLVAGGASPDSILMGSALIVGAPAAAGVAPICAMPGFIAVAVCLGIRD